MKNDTNRDSASPNGYLRILMMDYQDKYASLLCTDATVANIVHLIDKGVVEEVEALKMCVVLLASQKQHLMNKLADAEALVPRRHELPDGRVVRWDAPDDCVPVSR